MEKEFAQSHHRSITDAPSAIDVRDFNLWYGDFQALKHITLDIPERRCTAFIGPSGCGKSTLLRTFNRMCDFVETVRHEGAIEFAGKDVFAMDANALRVHVGMVFQHPNPFPMSIRDNVLYGGQQQRLCIARALATSPDVLLMDEPTSALDPISTLVVEELMQQLSREHTVVVVTHNMQQATRVADKTAFFYLGELIEAGPTKELFANPREQRTQEYLSGRFS